MEMNRDNILWMISLTCSSLLRRRGYCELLFTILHVTKENFIKESRCMTEEDVAVEGSRLVAFFKSTLATWIM